MSKLLIKIREFDAHGGPGRKVQGANDKFAATPTQAGRFIIKTIEKHISSIRYPAYSGLPWGAGVKIINDVVYVDVRNNGSWTKLTSILPVWKKLNDEKKVAAEIRTYWKKLSHANTASGDIWLYGSEEPNRWYFSDFGHISVKYFADRNHNGIMDGNEKLENDFIHTTPGNEAASFYNKSSASTFPKFQVNLIESHGCIHVKPNDVDVMIGSGYIKKGQALVVHSYSDSKIPPTIKPDKFTRPGFEVHFFPGLYKIAVLQSNLIIIVHPANLK